GSQHSLDIAASLLSNCVEKHERCGQEITALPSRVLDVGLTGDMIRLIDSRGLSGKYISLSHCWGSSETLTLTEESYESYLSGISISHLPKTFSDAIIIARHLETRYVWIDSLCIMQENQDDWARESGRMTDVYSNAYLVIAANHAKDGNGGCFHNREARPQAKINLPDLFEIVVQLSYAGEEVRWRGTEFEEEPLSGRGWALQERVLAQRILHYGTRQIYLECNHGIRGEDGCNFDDRYCCNLNDLDGKRELEDRPNYRSRASFEHGMWNNLLRQYGLRKLTKATDKLPAISGLARLFEDYLTADYVAGIWSDDLIEGLAWQSIGNGAPASLTQYTGPSWSWASYGGCAATGLRGHWKDVSQIEEWYVELQNQENPFGEVKSGWIRIHGPL
ncbi:heterokaryon incompatibility protein-domain-containing protein, partial [Tricladium varicosporioides]